jgi:hypothetical protein
MTLTDIVMTIGGTRSSAMPMPLITPIPQPSARISGTIHSSGQLCPCASAVARMAALFMTQGTDKSMPPPMMTTVCPIATMPVNAARVRRVATCAGLAKPGE